MDGSTPFQPWTSAGEGRADRTPLDPRAAQYSGPPEARGEGPPDAAGTPEAPGPPAPMDACRAERMQQIVENTLSGESRQHVSGLLGQISALGPAERLLLYLKLPSGAPAPDPLKQPLNPLGSRSEIQQTVMWIQTHLEVDPEISLPKQDVYEEYLEYCTGTKMKPLSTADFGKVMKQVYPCVKPRRLGTRGNSRYCYAGMRKRIKLEAPQLPDLGERHKTVEIPAVQNDLLIAASQLIREWAEKLLGIKFGNLCELAQHLVDKSCVDGGSGAALLLADTLAEGGEVPEGATLSPRGVIKELKRKIQAQPPSPGKNRPSKRSREPEEERGEEAAPLIKSEPACFPPYPAHPAYYPPPPLTHYPPPLNLSSQGGYLPIPPVPPPPRRLPLPGKKMILETYNNELNSPRDYSPQARAPPAPSLSPSQGTQYLPKKMRATESFGGKGLNRFPATPPLPEPYKRQPDACSVPSYTSLPVYGEADSGHAPVAENALEAEGIRGPDLFPPSQSYFSSASRVQSLQGIEELSIGTDVAQKEPVLLKKNKKILMVNNGAGSERTSEQPAVTRPAQRGRPRKKSLSKAKYTRRRPAQHAPTAPPACSHDSCSNLTDTINQSGIICAERHSEILNRERVISICSMDRHALDDYLNEGSSQEHEEELIKYLPQSASNPPDFTGLKEVQQTTENENVESAARDFTQVVGETSAIQSSLPSAEDFLDSSMNAGEDDKRSNDDVSKMREYLQKNLRVPSCPIYGEGEGAQATPLTGVVQPGPPSPEDGSPPQRFSFVPISPTASPFVSPRSTPQQGRRRRQPGLQLRREPAPVPRSFPMSAPPSPTILACKYRPSFAQDPTGGAGSVLRSFLQDTLPAAPAQACYSTEHRPPLSADPLCREVSQFFPEGTRSQSVPLAEGSPYFCQSRPPDLLLPSAPFCSYNNTPCSSIPPTPTPGDFCDFGNFNETCDSMSKSELDTENFHKICNELSFEEMSVEAAGEGEERGQRGEAEELLLMGGVGVMDSLELLTRSVPGTPQPLRQGEGSRSVPCTPGERACFSYSNRDFLINGNSLERDGSGGLPCSPLPLAAFSEDCGGGLPLSEQGLPESDLLADLRSADFYDM